MVCGGGPYAQNQKIVTRVKAQRRGYKYNRSNIPGRTFSQRKELNDSSSGYSQWRSKSTEGKLCPKFYASSVIIAKNSCSLISPSWSRSNSSIIACLRSRMRDCQMTIRVEWLRSYEANYEREKLTVHRPLVYRQFPSPLVEGSVEWFCQCCRHQRAGTHGVSPPSGLEPIFAHSL